MDESHGASNEVPDGLDACDPNASPDVANDAYPERGRPSKIFVPEGSIIRILKPVVWVEFKPIKGVPGETALKAIKLTYTVKSIQGSALKRLKNIISPDLLLDPKLITVTTGDGIELESSQSLVDFILPHYVTLFVYYPEDRFTFKQQKSPELDLDEDFFSIFDTKNA